MAKRQKRQKVTSDLALFLKNRRKELNLTQGQVAFKMGFTSAQFVSNWERGLAAPPLHNAKSVKKVVQIYKLEVDDYIDRLLNEQRRRLLAKLGLD